MLRRPVARSEFVVNFNESTSALHGIEDKHVRRNVVDGCGGRILRSEFEQE